MHNEHELRRAKRQLELHIWKTVIASRHHANKMKELQKLADEMMVSSFLGKLENQTFRKTRPLYTYRDITSTVTMVRRSKASECG